MTGAARPSGWREVRAALLARLRAREWGEGARLPPEAALAAEYGVARATVNRALAALAEEGVVDRRRRAGTRVRPPAPPPARLAIPLVRAEVEATGAPYRYTLLAREELAAPEWLSARLGLPSGAPVLHVACLHAAGPAPWQAEARWIVLAAVPAAREAPFDRVSPNEWLLRAVPYSEVETAISAVAADARLAALLGVAEGAALLRTERTTWHEGRPVTHARLTHAPGYRIVTRG